MGQSQGTLSKRIRELLFFQQHTSSKAICKKEGKGVEMRERKEFQVKREQSEDSIKKK